MRNTIRFLLLLMVATGCRSWTFAGPPRRPAPATLTPVADSHIELPVQIQTEAVRARLESDLGAKPLLAGNTDELSLNLLVNEKTFIEEPTQVVVVPYRAAYTVVDQVTRSVTDRVKVGVKTWSCLINPFKWGRCAKDIFEDQIRLIIEPVTRVVPEQLEVVKMVLTPVVKLKEAIAPTTAVLRYRADVERLGLRVQGQTLTASPQTKFTITLELKQGLLGDALSARGSVQCEVVLTPTVKAALEIVDAGAALKPVVRVSDVDLDLKKLCVPGAAEVVDLPVVFAPLPILLKNEIAALIEARLRDEANTALGKALGGVDLTTALQTAGGSLREPITLGNRAWLMTNPRSVSVSQLTGADSAGVSWLRMTASVVTRPVLSIGARPLPQTDTIAVHLGATGNRFVLWPEATIPLVQIADTLDAALRALVAEQQPKYRGVQTRVEVYQSDARLVFAVTLRKVPPFNTGGTLYLSGTPQFDSAGRTVRFTDLGFDLATRNFLLKAAEWALDGRIERALAQKLVFKLDRPIDDALTKLANFSEVTPSGVYHGSLVKLGLGGTWVAADTLHLTLRAEGVHRFVAKVP